MLTTHDYKTYVYTTSEPVNFFFLQITQKQYSPKNFGDNSFDLPFPSLLFFFTDMFGVVVGDSEREGFGFFPEINHQ